MTDRAAGRVSLVLSVATLVGILLLLHHRASTPSTASVAPRGAPVTAKAVAAVGGGSQFWNVIDRAHGQGGGDEGRESGLIKDQLTKLSPQAIIAFDQQRRRLDRQLYTWRIWGAATAIEDGC
jgi:uncharacterized protein DUF4240